MTAQPTLALRTLLGLTLSLAASVCANAQSLTGDALVKALQGGGYVLVIRHARSPTAPPSAGEAEPGNQGLERQLDEAGKRGATAMGEAVRSLHVPVGEVWSSPAFRARQTVAFAKFPAAKIAPELGDGGQSMMAVGSDQGAWLKGRTAMATKAGANTVLVTHLPNITKAYGQAAVGIADGETLVFQAGAKGDPAPVARIKIEDWPTLATRP